ncbi:MAG: hypothetical protein P1U47_12730 [Zhongshania sp.]|uniref:hypothetical protein n=1 Tax=Zhongshania sp. TaxID=1971902 RepID=UPI002638C020|nr:hypothetical protein [Zhongshania sp.]MDF1693237.1 hypothetical protein [Zhongshania sp.]
MTSSNNNKGKSTISPLATLHHLQSELFTLREKQINVLEKAIIVLEKEENMQKAQLDKARVQLKLYQDRLKDPKNAKPSAQGRIKTSVTSLQRNIESDQASLALLRGKIIEQRLLLRKERAVLKAMLDTDKSLGKPLSKPSANKAKPAVKEPAAARPKPAEKPAAKTAVKTEASNTAANIETPAALADTAPPSKDAIDLPRPKRRVRRMSDIPSHPDKQTDRLASLFDDF